jgi:hypothetical protein
VPLTFGYVLVNRPLVLLRRDFADLCGGDLTAFRRDLCFGGGGHTGRGAQAAYPADDQPVEHDHYQRSVNPLELWRLRL